MNSKRRILALVLATSLGSTHPYALDLTPNPGFRELEGMKIPVIFFADGARTVQWQAPAQWRISGGGTKVAFIPPEKSHALLELRLISRKTAEVPDGTRDPEAAASWAQPFLPSDPGKPVFVKEVTSPFLLGGLGSRELTFKHSFLHKDFTTSIAVVNLDLENSLAVIISASTRDFDQIYTEGTKSMFRWRWLGSPGGQASSGSRATSDNLSGR